MALKAKERAVMLDRIQCGRYCCPTCSAVAARTAKTWTPLKLVEV
jgi:hypothetical protein